jgi:hypothetical protein
MKLIIGCRHSLHLLLVSCCSKSAFDLEKNRILASRSISKINLKRRIILPVSPYITKFSEEDFQPEMVLRL